MLSPLPLRKDPVMAKQFIKYVINEFSNSKIVEDEDTYIRAEFTSSIFKFVDDVEFYFDMSEDQIHFRSASRRGKTDFGVNKKRMKEISIKYIKCLQYYSSASEK